MANWTINISDVLMGWVKDRPDIEWSEIVADAIERALDPAVPQSRRIPLRKAARRVGWGVARLRALINAGELAAFRVGGSETAPRLQVDVDELEQVIRRATVYAPPGQKTRGRQRPRFEPAELDPAISSWKRRLKS